MPSPVGRNPADAAIALTFNDHSDLMIVLTIACYNKDKNVQHRDHHPKDKRRHVVYKFTEQSVEPLLYVA